MSGAVAAVPGIGEALTRADAAVRHAATVAMHGVKVLFATDQPYGIAVMHGVFEPVCDVRDVAPEAAAAAEGYEWSVVSAGGLPGFDALHRAVARRVADAPAGRVTPVRRWKGDHEARRLDLDRHTSVILHDRPFRGLSVFDAGRRRSWYLRPGEAYDVPHTEHLTKYPLRVGLRTRGLVEVHGASCRYRDTGILMMGHRRSGKSTLVMQLVARGAQLVANDLSVAAPRTEGRHELVAMPHMTRLGPATIADNPWLRDCFAAAGERCEDYLRAALFSDGKEEIYYPVLRRILGRELALTSTPLDVVLLPALDLSLTRAEASRLPPERAREVVLGRLLDDPPLPEWLPFLPPGELRAHDEAHARALVERLPPVYELRFGAYATAPADAVDGIVDELAARGR